jgi:hypothetical protein
VITNRSLNVGEALRDYWVSQGLPLNDGVASATLESFEKNNGVVLPVDLRDYFRHVNGMEADTTDDALIRFWMLEEVRALPDAAPEYADSRYIERPESLFLFADFSLWAHAYAIRLLAAPSEMNEIFLIGSDSPILLFQSFSEFVDCYLTKQDRLFPQPQNL